MLVYLASPYSHEDKNVRDWRFSAACAAAGELMGLGFTVFSPIAHSHPISHYLGEQKGWDFWKAQDLPILERCDILAVLTLDGWSCSVGVQEEIGFAHKLNKAVITIGANSIATDIALQRDVIDRAVPQSKPKPAGGDAQYLALLDEMRDLHQKKAVDYGSDADPLANIRASIQCGIEPALAAWVRTLDKVHRINRYWHKRKLANESVQDSYFDLAAYALIGLRLLRETQAAQRHESLVQQCGDPH